MRYRTQIVTLLLAAPLLPIPAGAQEPPTKVVVIEAEVRDAPSTMTLVGTVNAVRRSKIGSEIAGIVKEMPVRQGDLVEAGGLLARLNDDALSLRLAEARARLGALTARHQELLAGTRAEELVRLKALLEEAAATYNRWKFEMERIEGLYQGNDSNAREVYDTRAEFVAAERRKIAAQATYDLGVAGPRQEVIANAAYEVAEQQAIVDRIASDWAKTSIRAPFTGYVVERTTEVGEWISAGGQVVEMADLSTVLVRVDVPESALPHTAVGDPARVRIDALQRSFEGRIKHVVRQADETARTFPVEIELDNNERLLAGGMFARATVTSGPRQSVVAVPKDALVQRDGVDYVAVVIPQEGGGTAGVLTPVTVGAEVDRWIAIRAGNVQPGSRVIIRGNEDLLPFPKPVVVVDDRGTPVSPPPKVSAALHKGDG